MNRVMIDLETLGTKPGSVILSIGAVRFDNRQLTDALHVMARDQIAGGVLGVVFRGRRYDTGDRLDYIKAIIQLAVERDDLGPELRPWLRHFSAGL